MKAFKILAGGLCALLMMCSYSAYAAYNLSGPSSDSDGVFTLSLTNTTNFYSAQIQRRPSGGTWVSAGSVYLPGGTPPYSFRENISGQSGTFEYRARGVNPCSGPGCQTAWGPIFSIRVTSPSTPRPTPTPTPIPEPTLPPAPSPDAFSQPSHNARVGGLPGEHSIEPNGSASYSIPIDLIGARNGLAPKLAFAYNSSGGNGALGIGWTMQGLSAIQRCPNDPLRGEARDPVDFDSNDKFCLNGVRLVALNSNSYVLENDDGTKITRYGSSSNPTHFKVLTPDGLINYYGDYNGSHPYASSSPEGTSYTGTWALARSQDRYSNYYTINYRQPTGSGTYRPYRIYYTGNSDAGVSPTNSVRFHYTTGRSDVKRTYLGGAYSEINWRLARVEIYSGSNELREYRLNYSTLTRDPHSPYINSIQLCADSYCMDPTRFSWSSQNFGYSSISRWFLDDWTGVRSNPHNAGEERYMDLNGDGLPDRLWRPVGLGSFYASINDGDSLGPPREWIRSSHIFGGKNIYAASDGHNWFADINGDGLVDRVWDPTNSDDIFLAINSGSGFNTPTRIYRASTLARAGSSSIYIDPRPNNGRNYFVDFDGDGLPDRLWMPKGRSDFFLSINQGNNTFSVPQRVIEQTIYSGSINNRVRSYSQSNKHEHVADVNGDGLPDRLWFPDGTSDLYVALNNGNNGFNNAVRWLRNSDYSFNIYSGDGRYESLIDLNADGLPDWLFEPHGGTNGIYVALNTGKGFAAPTKWMDITINGVNTYSYHGKYTDYGDFNGDGLPDRIWDPNGNDNNYYVALNTGHSFDNPIKWQSYNASGHNAGSHDGQHQHILDMNGDGADDRVWSPSGSSDNNIYVALGRKNDRLITRVEVGNGDDGAGHRTYFDYKSGLDRSVVTLSSRKDTFPYNMAPSTNAVVYRTRISNGIGGYFNTDYSYRDPRVHIGGYGALGYERMTVKNAGNGIETRTTFEQKVENKTQGTVKEVKTVATRDSRSPVLSLTTNTWENIRLGSSSSARNRLQLKETRVTKKDLDHSFLNYERNNYTYESSAGLPSRIVTRLYGNTSGSGTPLRTKTTTHTYRSFSGVSNYLMPGISKTKVDVAVSGKDTITTVSSWVYDSTTGRKLKERILHPTTESVLSEKEYSNIDDFGNHLTTTVRGSDFATRSSRRTFDSTGRYETSATNALNQTTSATYYSAGSQYDGKINEKTDINGIRTKYYYDSFGRQTRQINFYGTNSEVESYTSYQWCSDINDDSPCYSRLPYEPFYDAVYRITSSTEGGAAKHVYMDVLGREVKRRTHSIDGRYSNVVNHYDAQGRNYRVCDPFFDGEPVNFTDVEHDSLGRVIRSEEANGVVRTVDFNGLTRVSTNISPSDGSQTKTTIRDRMDNIVEVIDNDNNSVTYGYNSLGKLTSMVDSDNNTTTIQYDALGRKIEMNDPDKGRWRYTYNSLGQPITQTNARNETSCTRYDLLGRKTRHYDIYPASISRSLGANDNAKNNCANAGSSTYNYWTYDTAANKGKGKLYREGKSNGSYYKTYYYDSAYGRLYRVDERIDGTTYTTQNYFDSLHRVSSVLYPGSSSRLRVENVYNDLGFNVKLRNYNNRNEEYYSLVAMDAKGNVIEEVTGDGVRTTRFYNEITNQIQSIKGWLLTDYIAPSIQELEFEFDDFGNLTSRVDHIQNISETITYDDMNRIDVSRTDYGDGKLETINVNYDALGNITFKTGVGTYTYGAGSAGPHAVTSISSPKNKTYSYDANGNMTSGDGRTIRYTAFDKPYYINKSGGTLTELSYGPNRSRYKRKDTKGGKVTTYHYAGGGAFEKVTKPNGHIEERVFIGGVAIRTRTIAGSSRTNKMRYLHHDHLGSLTVITDSAGKIEKEFSFDAWGKRRAPNLSDKDLAFTLEELGSESTNIGFTGHEQMDGVGLIHMNGRVYDAELGRFLSADPHIQEPYNTQSLNRYSYVLNNPLSYTDPSGFFFKSILKKFVKAIKNFHKAILNHFKSTLRAIGRVINAVPGMSTVVGLVISFYCPPCGAAYFQYLSLLNAAISLANGAPIGAVLTNYAVGNVTAGVGGGIGGALGGGAVANAAGSMVASGIASKASGGKFIDGVKNAAIGMATGAAAKAIGNKLVAGLAKLGESKSGSSAPDNATGGDSETGSAGGMCSVNPINIATGEKYLTFRDYQAEGASTLKFERYYSSYNNEKGTLGIAWKHNFERKLDLKVSFGDAAHRVEAIRGKGDGFTFVEMNEGRGVEYKAVELDQFEHLVKTSTGYQLTLSDNTTEVYDNQGRLLEVRELSGYKQKLVYSEENRLERVEDSFGQTLQFEYQAGVISQVAFTDGAWVAFDYSTNDTLAKAISSDATPETLQDNPFKRYHYSDTRFTHAITGITNQSDEQVHYMAYDDYGHAVLSALGDYSERVDMVFGYGESDTKITKVTNALGKKTVYTFDRNNKPVSIEGHATESCIAANQGYQYNEDGLLISKTDWNNSVTQFEYNDRGLETLRIEAVGLPEERRTETQWHEHFRLPVKVVQAGRTTFYQYNENGLLVEQKVRDTQSDRGALAKLFGRYDQRTWRYDYNEQGLLAQVDGPRTDVNDIVKYTYDENGNRNTTTNALGHVTKALAHTKRGFPTVLVDANGVESHITYNGRGWVESKTVKAEAGDLVTQFTYTGKSDYLGEGLVESITLPSGERIHYAYNNARKLIAQSNNRGERIEYQLDAEGNRLKETVYSADGQIERTHKSVYDELSRLLASIGANGEITRYSYDQSGNRILVQDALNNEVAMAYDGLNRLVQSTDASGEIKTQYTADDQVASVTDQRGLTTEYRYNGFGDKIAQISPDTGTTHYTYDEAGNLLAKRDARGQVVEYRYDVINRITDVIHPNVDKENIRYVYDQYQTDAIELDVVANDNEVVNTNLVGRLAEIYDATGMTRYEYNDRGQVTEKTYTIDGIAYIQGYQYNRFGQLIVMIYPNGETVSYDHNNRGQLANIRYRDRVVAKDFSHKPFGPLSGFTYGNNSQLNMEYDQNYRVTDIRVNGNLADETPANDVIYDVGIVYDLVNNITEINDVMSPNSSEKFAYDDSYRLVNAKGQYGEINYAYDGVGNRLSREKLQGNDRILETYTYAQGSNRLLSVMSAGSQGDKVVSKLRELRYDAVGNIVRDAKTNTSKALEYSARNRLENVVLENGDKAIYKYNALGQRVSKNVNGKVTHFHYSIDKKLLAETNFDGEKALSHKWYIYGAKQRLAIVDQETMYYMVNDHLGTPKKLMNENQDIVWSEETTPFGEILVAKSDVSQPLRFPGQYNDLETGYSYNYFRDYDPSLGRYIQSDPIGLSGGVNTFGYLSGNPLSSTDVFGLCDDSTSARIGALKKEIEWVGGLSEEEFKNTFDPSMDAGFAQFKLVDDMHSEVEALTIQGAMGAISGTPQETAAGIIGYAAEPMGGKVGLLGKASSFYADFASAKTINSLSRVFGSSDANYSASYECTSTCTYNITLHD